MDFSLCYERRRRACVLLAAGVHVMEHECLFLVKDADQAGFDDLVGEIEQG